MTKAFYNQKNIQKDENSWKCKLILYLSFVWISIYTAITSLVSNLSLGYGRLFQAGTGNFYYEIMYILVVAFISMMAFEIMFWFYRYFLSFRIYSFVVPLQKLKNDCRLCFAKRNIFYGIFVNLCFLYPYIYNFLGFFNMFITLWTFVSFAYSTQKKYSEPIIGQFVFRNFLSPLLCYELLVGLYNFWGCL